MTDLALRTQTRPLTVFIHEVGNEPDAEAGRRAPQPRTDKIFTMLDTLGSATLERVGVESDAQFIVELSATHDPNVTTFLLRESIVVMARQQICGTADLGAITARFAAMIDTAAECYAAT